MITYKNKSLMKEKILVTGGTGYIGSHTVRTEHIIVETLASGKSTEVNPMGFTIVVEEVGHNPNHSYYDYV